ncbi:MAG: beta-ketoacyl synthase N-terminal-like domain-containing protein [Cyanobacteria bacterium J06648_16]
METPLVNQLHRPGDQDALQKAKKPDQSQRKYRLCDTPIAIVGMSGLFPESPDLASYWHNILREADCITEVPASRWDADAYYDGDPRAVDKTYCKRGGFVPDIGFDPMEFGLPPNILEATDIAQLLALVMARRAMEDAGYGADQDFDRAATGVVLGTVGRQLSGPLWARLQSPIWERVLKSSSIPDENIQEIVERIKLAYVGWQENSFPGMLSNVVAGRIANRFDFGGLNCTLDAACASSLAALKMAISELVEHRADMMLTGGVDPDNSAFTYLCFSKTPALSRQQMSRPFDADSDGIMLGEGVGMVVLKRLVDAERDGDRVYAVIRGLGTSSDGRYKSIYAPRPAGQIVALKRAYEDAGIDPATVGLMEAHGTGTAAGDTAEFESLKTLFEGTNYQPQSIALGTVKSQIGHTKTAAGVASLIKASLALHHKVLPPTINVSQPNPKLDIDRSPFYLNTKLRPWIQPGNAIPRRAGVSSFGFGGTNFHVVLEEMTPEQVTPYRVNPVPQSLLLWADTPLALSERCQTVLTQLRTSDAARFYNGLVASSQLADIPVKAARVGWVASDLADAVNKLETAVALLTTDAGDSWEHPQGIFYRRTGMQLQEQVVALFSGQGSQYVDMGQLLAANFPEMRQAFGQMDDVLLAEGLQPVSDVVYALPTFSESEQRAQTQRLNQTEWAQPAIGAFSMGLYRILSKAGLTPNFVAGHSFGELAALWAAGVLDDADYCRLVKKRGQAMAVPADANYDAGTMLAVKGDGQRIQALVSGLEGVVIANFNSDQQLVLAGGKASIEQASVQLNAQGFSPIPLSVSAAFHTERVSYAQAPFSQAVQQVTFKPAQIPVYSNVTANPYPSDAAAMQTLLQQHMISQVKFKQAIENIYAAGGRCFIEFGPRQVLTKLVKDILSDRPHLAIALNASRHEESDRQLRKAAMQLRVAGLPLKTIDPYQRPVLPTPTTGKLTVQLNGASYVSEKTQQAFEQALNKEATVQQLNFSPERPLAAAQQLAAPLSGRVEANGHTNGKANGHEGPSNGQTNGTHEGNGYAYYSHSSKGFSPATTSVPKPIDAAHPRAQPVAQAEQVLQSLDRTLAQFSQHQSHIARTHEHYLANHREYTQAVHQLTQQQQSLLAANNHLPIDPTVAAISERSLMTFHAHQQETLRVHESYLNHQINCAKQFFTLGQQTYQALTGEQSAIPAGLPLTSARQDDNGFTPSLSLSAPEETLPTLSVSPSLPLETISTEALTPEPEMPLADLESPAGALAEVPLPIETQPVKLDMAKLEAVLLSIVSDKTGYPAEMLELDMDMEADLGIDSLKRVEIIGAFQEAFPELPQPDLETLAEIELRTLGQVADYMRSLVPSASPQSDASTPTETPAGGPTAAVSAVSELAPTSIVSTAAETSARFSVQDVQTQLLSVVSDKTGYPAEMLELDMDMEADLGIDSLKRVEIIGAFQEAFPELPQPDLETLAEIELRTLGQVADYMRSLIPAEKKSLMVG